MPISIVEVVEYKYPNQFEAGNVAFFVDETIEGGINIQKWSVPGVEQPAVADLVALFPTYEAQYANSVVLAQCSMQIMALLDKTAKLKQYANALSCASYASSTNTRWAAEAKAFIDWRDAVFLYLINIENEVTAGTIPCPTVAAVIAGIPALTWPD